MSQQRRRRTQRPAGGGSAAAAALKGRATNQPSCYVNVGSTGIGMLSAGHYVAPPPGTIPTGATVEGLAKESTYFQDLAAVEKSEDTTSILANFLQNRGPSFGPDFSGGNQPGSMVTPSMTRTVDRKVFQRVSRPLSTIVADNNEAESPEYDDDDDDFEDDEEGEEGDSSDSEDDDEDEPFVGGQHPAASYATTLAADAKKEEDKQMLLAQAFAYVTKLERQSARDESIQARKARRGGHGGASGSSKSKRANGKNRTRSNGGKGNGNGNGSGPSRKQRQQQQQQSQKNGPRQGRQHRGGRQQKKTFQLGARRDQAQSRLYGKKSTKSKDIDKQPQQSAAQEPSAPAVLQNTYINMSTVEDTNASTKNNSATTKRKTTNVKNVTRKNKSMANMENNENNENTVVAENSIADHFLSFQSPPMEEQQQQPMTGLAAQPHHSDSFLRRGGGPRGRPGVGGNGGGPSGRDRKSSGGRPQERNNNNNLDHTDMPTRRVKKGELTAQEMKLIVGNLQSGTSAQRLRAELEEAQNNMSESESAFKRAQEEFAMLF